MYGHFILVLRDFIIERQGGEPAWGRIHARAKCEYDFDNNFVYDDKVADTIITLAIDVLGLPKEPLLEMIGEYYLTYLEKRGFDEMLRNLGHNVLEFLQNLDSVHVLIRRDYPDMVAPSFRCDEDSSSDRMVLHYYSKREGLHSIVKGLTVEAAKKFYTMQLEMSVVSIETIKVSEENGFREHVTFDVIAKKIKEQIIEEGPPTFIAQTKKHSEKQILKEDVEAVKQKLEQIRLQLGENALPLNRKTSIQARWKIAAKITAMHRGFVPNYPETLAINPRMFIEMFPYHVIFDNEMKVVQSGIKIQMLMPSIRSRQAVLSDFFHVRWPSCVDLNYENIGRFVLCPFILEFRRDAMEREWNDRPALQLKGQMFLLRDRGFYAYMASPAAHCWADLENRKLKLSDIPMWDVTRDFLVADLEYRKCIQTNVRESLSGSLTDGRRISVSGARRGSLGDEAAIRDRISRLQSEAEKERRKNEALYSAFLPKDAIDLVNGGLVPYGDFQPQVTALFCDVVKFLPIVAKSSPQDVIGMLDAMFNTFDKITRVHDTYRVESIGDAYLVIAGTGDQKEHHAERVANTALGMLLAARDVKAPPDNISVTLRIGIHTGSLVTGVLGNRVPRFVVMGETTVVASKLESHGEPGKIHVSPTTQTILKDKGYQFEARGKIDLRGYGPLETYFLVKNDLFSDKELIGRSHGNQEVTYINEGKVEATFAKQNKVHPLTTSPPSGGASRQLTGESEDTIIEFKK